ncbi:MAG: TonB-dependent receptor, partial [Flavobacteriales bacterium]|nr:TonB-dependent receptor [Flavobacteriales bacterium]
MTEASRIGAFFAIPMGMWRTIQRVAVLAAACAGWLVGTAQISVQVLDDAGGRSLPDVHVAWQPLAGGSGGTVLTGTDGRAELPVAAAQLHPGVVVRASHVGYTTRQDTLHGAVPCIIRLRHDAVAMRELVVTGQYGPTRADQAVHKVRVLDEAHLQRLAANDLADALRNELNIRLAQDNALSSTGMSMQGLGGENVKILIDGIPIIGRQDGKLDLTQIDLNGIERVEVVEGPLSVSYGTNALAGTINLITRKHAPEHVRVRASAYTEHIGRLNLWGGVGKRWGRHHFNLDLGRDFFAGWSPGRTGLPDLAPAPADTMRWRQWKPREQYNLRLNHRWTGDRWQLGYKGEVSHDLITDRGRPAAPYYDVAFDTKFRTERIDNALFADRYWRNGRKLTMLAAHDRYKRTSNTWRRDLTDLGGTLTPGTQDTSLFTLTNVRVVYASAADSARLRYELGADLNHETASGDRIGEARGEAIGDHAVYTSVEYRPVDRLVLRPAVRYAYNTVYGAPIVPSFNLRWQLPHDLALRASYARGFRAPSLKELHLFFVDVNHNIEGNTQLKAERSHNMSASLTWAKVVGQGRWRAEIGGFHNAIEDLITLAQVSGTLYSYINIGHYRTTGGTVGVGWENERWTWTVGGNLTGRSDDLAREQSDPWLWSHEVRANVAHTWTDRGWSVQLFHKYQGALQTY